MPLIQRWVNNRPRCLNLIFDRAAAFLGISSSLIFPPNPVAQKFSVFRHGPCLPLPPFLQKKAPFLVCPCPLFFSPLVSPFLTGNNFFSMAGKTIPHNAAFFSGRSSGSTGTKVTLSLPQMSLLPPFLAQDFWSGLHLSSCCNHRLKGSFAVLSLFFLPVLVCCFLNRLTPDLINFDQRVTVLVG